MATTLYEGWDHRWLGTATMTLTDSNGANVVSITTGTYCHLSLAAVEVDSRSVSTINTGFTAFAAALQTAINAACTLDYLVTFSGDSLEYQIESDLGGSFTLAFGAGAGDIMRRILGFTATTGSAVVHSSNARPWYLVRAEIDGRSNYSLPLARTGQIRTAIGDDAAIYSLGPTRLVKTSKWEHAFEQPARVHRYLSVADTVVGGVSWTWEDWMDHAARYSVPCVIVDSVESLVFRTSVPFEGNAARRRKKDAEPQQIVAIDATAIVGRL